MLQNRKIEILSKEVCPGWIDRAPANAWAIIYKAQTQDINATTAKGIQRTSEALENRAKRLKPAHMTGPGTPDDTLDTENPLETDHVSETETEQGPENTRVNRNTPDSPGTHWQDEGERENPAKRPHTENTARSARLDGGVTDTENDYTTQNWTQHTHTQQDSDKLENLMGTTNACLRGELHQVPANDASG